METCPTLRLELRSIESAPVGEGFVLPCLVSVVTLTKPGRELLRVVECKPPIIDPFVCPWYIPL